jgi:hypothetical protein
MRQAARRATQTLLSLQHGTAQGDLARLNLPLSSPGGGRGSVSIWTDASGVPTIPGNRLRTS